jgi:hypothetical protein
MTTKAIRTGRGPREAYLVYAPSIASDTLLHLSIRGNSYRLRDSVAGGPNVSPRVRILPNFPSIDDLRASHLISRWLPVTRDDLRQNLILKPGYWYARIQGVNARQLNDH